jgi:hypothetical protein
LNDGFWNIIHPGMIDKGFTVICKTLIFQQQPSYQEGKDILSPNSVNYIVKGNCSVLASLKKDSTNTNVSGAATG